MILANGNDNTKIIKINCDCGCDEEIEIKKFMFENEEIKPEEDEYYISIHTSKFYSEQKSILKIISHRIILAFKMLFGKEYRLTEVCMKRKDIDDLIKCLEEIKKN